MALKQHQEIKQAQKLSPLQMQLIRLIELNTVELEEKVKQELEENPALDEKDLASEKDDLSHDDVDNISQEDLVMGDYLTEDDIPQYQINRWDNNETNFIETTYADVTSLNGYLMDQIRLRELSEDKEKIAEYIIGNLDENGYLNRSLQLIADDLLFQQQITVSQYELQDILFIIQDLDPAGVGATDLRECLLLQLERSSQSKRIELAKTILLDYFEEFSLKHYDKMIRQLEISRDDLREAISEITSLNPKPGNMFEDSVETHMSNITPDFIVETDNGEVTLHLNKRNVPELSISRNFSDLLQGYTQNKKSMSNDDKQALMFMKQKFDSAKWFIDAIQQRQDTLQKTMEAIIKIQYDFFLTEDETTLKPMILKDIAEKTNLDISTISRVSSSKYVQTNTRIYPLRFFFSEAMQSEDGKGVSTRKIKAILKNTVDNEDKNAPLSDEQLTNILNERGIVIARRTVAKYREQLNIPVARLRKKL